MPSNDIRFGVGDIIRLKRPFVTNAPYRTHDIGDTAKVISLQGTEFIKVKWDNEDIRENTEFTMCADRFDLVERVTMKMLQCHMCLQYMLSDTERKNTDYGNKVYCLECYNKTHFRCDSCGNMHSNDLKNSDTVRVKQYNEVMGTDYDAICAECINEVSTCEHCCGAFHADQMYYNDIDGSLLCEDCHRESYTRCEHCNTEYRVGEYCPNWCDEDEDCDEGIDDTDTNDYKDELVIIRSKRKFGIEIECKCNEGIALHKGWKSKEDSSISGNNGVEIVSPKLSGMLGLKELNEQTKRINSASAYVDRSCGVHVHVNVEKMSLKSRKNVGVMLYNWEAMLYACLPDSRDGNGMSDCINDREHARINEWYASDTFKLTSRRYHGFNSHAYNEHSTIEFRYHSGTANYEKLARYIKLCLAIVNVGKRKKSILHKRTKQTARNLMRFMRILKLDENDRRYWLKRFCHFQGIDYAVEVSKYFKTKVVV